MKIVLATHNKGKMEEISAVLSHLSIQIQTLDLYPHIGDIPEIGKTLKENAFIKAETVHRLTGLPALADDTGLEVKALNGAPGIFSARYAGEKATNEENCKKILNDMASFRGKDRSALFKTVIAFVTDHEKIWTEGVAKGTILNDKNGDEGFGYDPIFYYPPLKKSFATMNMSEKNSVSHRGKALRSFSEILKKQLKDKNG